MAERLVDPEANAKRIENVEKCFFGSLTQPLNIPSRILVGEGILTKMCRKKPKPRQFFLFDDILVYGTIVIARKKYNSMHVIDLAEVKLQSLVDSGELKNGWQIISPKKSFSVYAATAQEKVEWMAHINRCVQDLVKKRGIQQTTDDSPVWIPDSEANRCMVCQKSEFTVLNRKHHCRKCGKVVCNPCSTKKWLLPSQSNKPQRVCDSCYDKLNRTGGADEAAQFAAGAALDETSDSSSDEDEPQSPASPNSAAAADSAAADVNSAAADTEPHFYETPSESTTDAGGDDVTPAENDVTMGGSDVTNGEPEATNTSNAQDGETEQ